VLITFSKDCSNNSITGTLNRQACIEDSSAELHFSDLKNKYTGFFQLKSGKILFFVEEYFLLIPYFKE
jgi:hypothetical protein